MSSPVNIIDNEKFKLCYIEGNLAWFTTAELDKQWGDDWNDAPYEHNAGSPYEWREGSDEPEYKLMRVVFYTQMETPADISGCNSPYSVQAINAGAVAWLVERYGKKCATISAGCTPEKFMATVKEAGGDVFMQV